MSPFNSLTFNITGVPGDLTPGHPLWDRPLAGRSKEFSGRPDPAAEVWTIGDYFLAARAFVSRHQVLERMTAAQGRDAAGSDLWDVRLSLEKHGAFYHPMKVTVLAGGIPGRESFVLNGAVNDHGRDLARKEARLLSLLEQRLPFSVTPRVYTFGEVSRPQGQAGFLLAQWLEGYYEFHVTEARGQREIAVWRPGDRTRYLAWDLAVSIYENIARILTLAYDPVSGGQVLFWHHGAGDFIVAPGRDTLPVKLITVREYGSMADEAVLTQGPMPGLFFFFLNLCLRMQLDRLDGVGRPVFLGPEVLASTVRGFLRGLGDRREGKAVAESAWTFFSEFTDSQLRMVIEQMLEIWPAGPSEGGIIAGEIGAFAAQIRALLKTGRFSDFY